MKNLIALIILIFIFAGCGASSSSAGQGTKSSNKIENDEIQEALSKQPFQNAYELISYLRPTYLNPRAQYTVGSGVLRVKPAVYVNNVKYGEIGELYNIGVGEITGVQYFKASDASYRFGMGHEGGVILISTR